MEAIIVAIIGAISVISTTIIQTLTAKKTKRTDERFEELDKKIDGKFEELDKKVDAIAIGGIKNFLVRTLAELENGEKIDDAVKARLYEEYDRYTKEYHQNSYIHTKWEKLRKEEKL